MQPSATAQIVIVGAGVSGLALAVRLGRAGYDVLVVDKAPAPRDKVCGEGIMPLGLRCLAQLGIAAGDLPGVEFDGLDYLALARGHALNHPLRFPAGTTGRGVRRTRLLEVLERAARACPSVRMVADEIRGVETDGGRVTAMLGNAATYRARVFVAADGVNSRLARWCGARSWRYGERMALRRHYHLLPGTLPSRVQVGLLGSHDVYLTPVGSNELLATTLTDRAGYQAALDAPEGYDGYLRAGPYGALFASAEPASECLSWYHPLFHARRYVASGVLLVGDSGGGIDPCLGMGMSLGLHTALAAGDTIDHALQAGAAHTATLRRSEERAFTTERRRLFLHYHHFGRVFRALVGSEKGARLLMAAMNRLPRVADRLLAIVADLRPWWSLIWPQDSVRAARATSMSGRRIPA